MKYLVKLFGIDQLEELEAGGTPLTLVCLFVWAPVHQLRDSWRRRVSQVPKQRACSAKKRLGGTKFTLCDCRSFKEPRGLSHISPNERRSSPDRARLCKSELLTHVFSVQHANMKPKTTS
eukprot:9487749-Pyramimonas_sp.AAC.1